MRYAYGIPGWVDLSTPDVETARTFYEGLFGWTSVDMPTPMGPAYTQFSLDGKLVCGMGPLPPEAVAAGMPPWWNSYVLVEDLDATVAAALAAGGQVVMPAMDIMTQGRMAMVADPSGAAIGLWQPIDHEGADVFNVPGALNWNELQSRDLDAALPFYETVFGWRWEKMPDYDYYAAHLDAKPGDDKSVAGAMTMPPQVPAEAPSSWMIYFTVADCDAAVARATELGGVPFMPTMDMPGMRFAGITDPTGGMFFLLQAVAAG